MVTPRSHVVLVPLKPQFAAVFFDLNKCDGVADDNKKRASSLCYWPVFLSVER